MKYIYKEISKFDTVFESSPNAEITFKQLFNGIRNGDWKDKVEAYREGKLKKNLLPCVTPSGLFTSKKDSDLIGEHTGVIVLDLDGKDNPNVNIDEIKTGLYSHRSVIAVCKSVGGRGLAIFVALANNLSHDDYSHVSKTFEDHYKIKLDPSTKNVARLRYVTYDSEILIKEKVYPFDIKPVEKTVTKPTYIQNHTNNKADFSYEYQRAQSAIEGVIYRGVDPTPSRREWHSMGFAIVGGFGESGRELFHLASRNYLKYTPEETNSEYDTLLNNNDGRSGIGLMYHLLKNY